ncbi:CDP-diacylglycerol--inositol 3-phosphatidyltransferase [Tetranychus urticae]|uniref:CDP-diacylglycerol--inositol 3-phosphatidyltransferase n=1 Tax=Tetranychus urticae TaxID=32264 RepID=T1KUU4_TETUR|nr:CDP-diacylglycerol--inositol 3-phosphatidyltransferase [Tetranychus urticae]
METRTNILLFVPNLIGYARIILAFISFYYMKDDYLKALFCYFMSAFLDAFDGHAARLLNQSTKFGAILDQLTDRCGTMGLVMVLALFYPKYMFFFQLVNIIDIAGHWLHIWVSLLQGKSSHKFIDLSENKILRIYYTSRPVLFFMCAANELFFVALYLCHFTYGPFRIFPLIAWISGPFAILKLTITVLQGFSAVINIACIDASERAEAESLKGKQN